VGSADVSGSTVTAGGSISSYTLTWGDGSAAQTSSSNATTHHPYHHSGTYTVTLTVRANTGATASTSAPLAVNVHPPNVVVSDKPTSGNGLGVTVDVNGSTTGGWPLGTVTIAWGDGRTTQFMFSSNPATNLVSHVYPACPINGPSYPIALTIADSYGNTAAPVNFVAALSCLA
jgi:PKD repeat protein